MMKKMIYVIFVVLVALFFTRTLPAEDDQQNLTTVEDTAEQGSEDRDSEFLDSILPAPDSFPEGRSALREMLKDSLLAIRVAAAEDEDEGLFVQPQKKPAKVGFENREERFSWKKRTVPVYEYETYKVMERDTSGELREVTKKRNIGQTGTKETKYLVRDPEGDVYKTIKVPIHEKDAGAPEINPGIIGQNALCIYASIKMGIPYDDPINANCLFTLSKYLYQGLPDNTFDLACLTALYVNLPQKEKRFSQLASMMVNKLLNGQITSKKGFGLWGPACVNNEIMAKLQAAERDYIQKDYSKLKDKLKGASESKRLTGRLESEMEKFEEYQRQVRLGYSQIIPNYSFGAGAGMPSFRSRDYYTFGKTEAEPGINISSYVFYPFSETLADIESTAFVLFALREAARNGVLPKATTAPLDPRGRAVLQPKNVSQILKNAYTGLIGLKDSDGTWGELNLCLPVRDYDKLGYPGLPVDEKKIFQLPSQNTAMSRCLASASILFLAEILNSSGDAKKVLDANNKAVLADLMNFGNSLFEHKEDIIVKPYYSFKYLLFASEIFKDAPEAYGKIVSELESDSVGAATGRRSAPGRRGLVTDTTSSMTEYLKLSSEMEKELIEKKESKKKRNITAETLTNQMLAKRGFLFAPDTLTNVYRIMTMQNLLPSIGVGANKVEKK